MTDQILACRARAERRPDEPSYHPPSNAGSEVIVSTRAWV